MTSSLLSNGKAISETIFVELLECVEQLVTREPALYETTNECYKHVRWHEGQSLHVANC